jgi:hypothetical protein
MASNGREVQKRILALLGSVDYRPLDKSGLVKGLGRKSDVHMDLKQMLRDPERAVEIARMRTTPSGYTVRIVREETPHVCHL